MAKKNTDVAGSETPADMAPARAKTGSSRPIWTLSINRVDGAIWPHEQEDGMRYSVAISRSYFDKKSNEVKRSHYFDLSDLADLHALATAAQEYIRKLRDEAQTAQVS